MTTALRKCVFNVARTGGASLCLFVLPLVQRLSAQPVQRFNISVGATGLPMGVRSGGTTIAGTVVGRVRLLNHQRLSGSVVATAIAPAHVNSVVTDCVPDGPCVSYKSPDAFYGAAAEIGVHSNNRKFRATAAVGFLSAQNLSDITSTNSPTFELGAEYVILPARRVSPVLGLRVLRLTRSVAGLEAVVLPTFGIAF